MGKWEQFVIMKPSWCDVGAKSAAEVPTARQQRAVVQLL